jgi:hypothetical protein
MLNQMFPSRFSSRASQDEPHSPGDTNRAWAADLCRPLPLAAMIALALNDHVGKSSLFLPAILRGKLSDVAGLFFFPIFLFALVDVATHRLALRHRAGVVWICAIATAVAFTLLKTCLPVNALAERWWGPAVLDPTDLAALPAIFAAAWWMQRRAVSRTDGSPAWSRVSVLAFAALLTAATPAPLVLESLEKAALPA